MSFTRVSTLNQNIKTEHNQNIVDSQKITDREPQTSTPLKASQIYYDIKHEEMVSNNLIHSESSNEKQKSTRFLGNRAVSILLKWFHSNKNYPYPDEATTDRLAKEAEISCKQVKKWFANKRVRSQLCCKPVHRHRRRNPALNQNQNINDDKVIIKNQDRSGEEFNPTIPSIQTNWINGQYIGTPKTPINRNIYHQHQQQHMPTVPNTMQLIQTNKSIPSHSQPSLPSGIIQNPNLMQQMGLYNPLLMMNAVLASSSPLNNHKQNCPTSFIPTIPQQQQQQQQHFNINNIQHLMIQNPYYYQNFIKEYLQQQQQQQQHLQNPHHKKQQEIVSSKNDSIYYGDDEENSYSLELDDIKNNINSSLNKLNNDYEDEHQQDDDDDDDDNSIDIEDLDEAASKNEMSNNSRNNKENLILSKIKQQHEQHLIESQKQDKQMIRLENSTGSTTESYTSTSYTESLNYSGSNVGVLNSNQMNKDNNKTAITTTTPTSSSVSPYSSISPSSSINSSSNSNTPNTQIYANSTTIDNNNKNDSKTLVRKKFENKKINFAVIASLID